MGTLKKRSSEVVETLTRGRVDTRSVQEHRWAGGIEANQTCLMKGKNSNYKFYWCGSRMGLGVGLLLAEKWIEKVFDVQCVSDRILLLCLVIDKTVFAFISVYAPQVGRPDIEKEQFYDLLQEIVSKVPNSEVLIPIGDWNSHVGRVAGAFEAVHGGFGYGNCNIEGERLLEFAVPNNLIVGNTQFKKRDSHLITYSSRENNSQIDYILYPKSFKKSVINVKVIPGEECTLQHHILVCELKITTPKIKKHNFSPRLGTWKLHDLDIINKFTPIFNTKLEATQIDPSPDIEEIWSKLKTTLLETTSVVCGSSSKHQWRPVTWWWDDRVEDAINDKRSRYRTYKKLRKHGHMPETIAAKEAYNLAKRVSKHVVWLAKSEAEKEAFALISPNGNEIFHIAKQIDKTNQDVVGEKCMKNDAGELSLSDDQKMKSWDEYYSRLLNVEFEWPSDHLRSSTSRNNNTYK